jgi:uncharacterized protein YndB with AHSA1/START domain
VNMTSDDELFLSRWIRAERAAVYAAWTEPELMQKWFCPGELRLVSAEADVRVGGRFRAEMSDGSETHTVHGVYREVIPGRRLVFSHRWQERDAVETVVTVEFADRDGGTLVSLTHAGFRDRASRTGHEGGWASTFDSLQRFLAGSGGGAR